ncbi:hypothetical protein J7L27_07915 [Candidatus Bathyarchaeota archaeon]|nr:hypothetical protein [Candidatus Bathyarchaeota archaeon]
MTKSRARVKTEYKNDLIDKKPRIERCRNPWNSNCRSTKIALYIIYKGERIPICWKCWKSIANKNIEWEAY